MHVFYPIPKEPRFQRWWDLAQCPGCGVLWMVWYDKDMEDERHVDHSDGHCPYCHEASGDYGDPCTTPECNGIIFDAHCRPECKQ